MVHESLTSGYATMTWNITQEYSAITLMISSETRGPQAEKPAIVDVMKKSSAVLYFVSS